MSEILKPIDEAVMQAIREVSTCWSEAPKGVFDLLRAEKIANELIEKVKRHQLADNQRLREALDKLTNEIAGYEKLIVDGPEGLKRMIAAYETNRDAMNLAVQTKDADIQRLREALKSANRKLDEIAETFDHQNMSVNGWHLNGQSEKLSNFFEENDWYSDDEALGESK